MRSIWFFIKEVRSPLLVERSEMIPSPGLSGRRGLGEEIRMPAKSG
jgi:hypothetical protein